jgi:uncharacterized protein
MKVFLMASLVALALALPMSVEAEGTQTQMISGTRLELSARGESHVVPDIAIISAGVVTQSPDAATAMRDNAARITRVMTALKKAGLADKDIQTQAVSLSPQYRYANNEVPVITGYQASNTVNVRFRDIGKSGAVLDALVKEGANQINGPTLSIDNPDVAQDAARLSALKILQGRAALYARSVGMQVKRIVSLSESVEYQQGPMPMMAMARSSDAGEAKTSISAGEQAVGVTVSAVFELQ